MARIRSTAGGRGTLAGAVLLAALAVPAAASVAAQAAAPGSSGKDTDADPYGNWFNDPYAQVRDGVPGCPEPIGPLMRRSQMKSEEHYRVERGTSCWLAHKCEKPNAYQYDAGIAARVIQHFKDSPEFKDTTLWITVQRRFVFVNGCGAGHDLEARIERFVRVDPEVEAALVDIASDPHGRIPYKLKPS